jgi:secretory phospholipase A2
MAHVVLIILLFVTGSVNSLRQRRQANGCGTENGFKVDQLLRFIGMDVMIECCNQHDICYDTCANIRETYDNEFEQCLLNICDTTQRSGFQWWIWVRRLACKGVAKIMYSLAGNLGTEAFLKAQKNRCHPGISPKSG